MTVPATPEGYHSVTTYLIIHEAEAAIHFYTAAFGATEVFRLQMPDGTIAHAEIRIGDTILMLAEASLAELAQGPTAECRPTASLMIYTEDPDAMFARALAAGATQLRPMADQFYGDRSGTLRDPFHHVWTIAKHLEDVSPAEGQRRLDAMIQSATA